MKILSTLHRACRQALKHIRVHGVSLEEALWSCRARRHRLGATTLARCRGRCSSVCSTSSLNPEHDLGIQLLNRGMRTRKIYCEAYLYMGGWISSFFGGTNAETEYPMATPIPTSAPYSVIPTSAPMVVTPPPALMTSAPLTASMTPAPLTAAPLTSPAIIEPGPSVVIPGNNGSVSCARFCSGPWGQSQLSARYPQYSGAYSNQFQASADGTCPCLMTNKVTWNQNTSATVDARALGIV